MHRFRTNRHQCFVIRNHGERSAIQARVVSLDSMYISRSFHNTSRSTLLYLDWHSVSVFEPNAIGLPSWINAVPSPFCETSRISRAAVLFYFRQASLLQLPSPRLHASGRHVLSHVGVASLPRRPRSFWSARTVQRPCRVFVEKTTKLLVGTYCPTSVSRLSREDHEASGRHCPTSVSRLSREDHEA